MSAKFAEQFVDVYNGQNPMKRLTRQGIQLKRERFPRQLKLKPIKVTYVANEKVFAFESLSL